MTVPRRPTQKWWILILFVLPSCSGSRAEKPPQQQTVIGAVTVSTNDETPRTMTTAPGPSSSRKKAPTTNEPASKSTSPEANENSFSQVRSTTSTPGVPTTLPPQFLSFGCSVSAFDYSSTAPVGYRSVQILVQTVGPTTGGVWVELTAQDFRRRLALKLDAKGAGRTVAAVPDETVVDIRIHASSTFEPASTMCTVSN